MPGSDILFNAQNHLITTNVPTKIIHKSEKYQSYLCTLETKYTLIIVFVCVCVCKTKINKTKT